MDTHTFKKKKKETMQITEELHNIPEPLLLKGGSDFL